MNDIALRDRENPQSVISLVPPNLAQAIQSIPEELFLVGETDLRR